MHTTVKQKGRGPARSSTLDDRQGETRKMASSSLYLDELLIQKCKFRDRFTSQLLAWKGFPRRVHATLTNPAWITHLLRNILSNYWCGMHRTCQKHLSYTWQETLDDQERKPVWRNSFYVLARWIKSFWCSSFFLYWPWKIPDCDNSAEMKWKSNRLAGSRLGRVPWQYRKEIGSKPWTTGDHNLAGTHGWSVRASWDACKELRWAELCKPPLPPCI